MGYPRRTADLVTQNNIFVDISNDRVGIGTDQPTVKLDVVGNAAISGNLNVAGVLTYEDVTNVDAVGLITARSGLIVTGVATATTFSGSGASLTSIPNSATTATSSNTVSTIVARDGSGNFTAGTITATDFNSTSDIFRKKNLREVVNSLEILKDIRGVRFDWIENGFPSVGVIAQEVEQVLPELVNENDGIKSVNYNGLVGVLIEAVKELQAEVEELKRTR